MSQIITTRFQSTEAKTFLCVTLFVSQPFLHVYTRLHSCVSTDAMTDFHIVYADLGSWTFSFVGSRVWIQICAWNFLPLISLCCILVAANGTSWSLIRNHPVCVCVCVCVSNCVCDLGTSTVNVGFSLAAAPQKGSNIIFTYRHSNTNRRLLPAARHCGCFRGVDL